MCSECSRKSEVVFELKGHVFRLRHGVERGDEPLHRIESRCTIGPQFASNNRFDHGAVVVAVITTARARFSDLCKIGEGGEN
jgi:hypothetical protein